MELSFHLRTLQPLKGALDILRYFGTLDTDTADADQICTALDLSDRSFSKAIRRLVTKGYVTMDGDMIYRLTDQGHDSVEELAEYDEATGATGLAASSEPTTPARQTISRRLVMALPSPLVAEEDASVVIGFHGGQMSGSAEMVVRVSVINGEPEYPEDAIFNLDGAPVQEALSITPGRYDTVRVRLQVFQLGDNPDEIDAAGGMYVDVPVVAADSGGHDLVAYGTDVTVRI